MVVLQEVLVVDSFARCNEVFVVGILRFKYQPIFLNYRCTEHFLEFDHVECFRLEDESAVTFHLVLRTEGTLVTGIVVVCQVVSDVEVHVRWL